MGFGRGCPAGWLSWIFGLARVTEMSFLRRGKRVRFIPAGTGNTAPQKATEWLRPVYPRWRGEHEYSTGSMRGRGGLSPLARGTLAGARRPCQVARFIPAGAGNTNTRKNCGAGGAVYPRWRGEHHIHQEIFFSLPGLSPLARGTHLFQLCRHGTERFIPAGAGNTLSTVGSVPVSTVYPRWRGEHMLSVPCPHITRGLSPLARGTR